MEKFKTSLRNNAKIFQRTLDISVAVFSFLGSFLLVKVFQPEFFTWTHEYVKMLLLTIPTWAILIKSTNLAHIPRSRTYMSIFFRILNFNLVGFIVLLLYKFIFQFESFSGYFLLTFSITNTLALFIVRLTTFRVIKGFRSSGHNVHNLVIIADKNSEKFIDDILDHKEWGYRIVCIFSDSSHIRETYSPTIRVLPERSNIKNFIKYDIVDEVFFTKRDVDIERMDKLISTCKELGVTFKVNSEASRVEPTSIPPYSQLTSIKNSSFLTYTNSPNNSFRWIWKSISDFIISGTLLTLLSPLFLIIMIIIRATSKGPAIFKQSRVGLHGRQFYIYKFRTMVQNAEELKAKLEAANESDGPTFKIKDDPRITSIGRFLRKTSIDELPQLINVLQGEMSLIGPRPPLPKEVEEYENWHVRRLSVKPGITCTWQIVPNRNDVVFDKWMKLDMEYIDKWSLKADLSLFFRTIKSVLINKGY